MEELLPWVYGRNEGVKGPKICDDLAEKIFQDASYSEFESNINQESKSEAFDQVTLKNADSDSTRVVATWRRNPAWVLNRQQPSSNVKPRASVRTDAKSGPNGIWNRLKASMVVEKLVYINRTYEPALDDDDPRAYY